MSCAHTHPPCVVQTCFLPPSRLPERRALAMASDGQLLALVALYQATNRAQRYDTGGGQTHCSGISLIPEPNIRGGRYEA